MDLEMTGLDPGRDVIVEIATLITDDELNILVEGPDLVVHQPDDVLAAMDPFVVDMHTRSGLLEAIKASTVTLEEAGAATLAFIREHVAEPRTVPSAATPSGPTAASWLPTSPRSRTSCTTGRSTSPRSRSWWRWYPRACGPPAPARPAATAPDDIRESVAELRYYRERVFVPPIVPEEPVIELPPAGPSTAPAAGGQ